MKGGGEWNACALPLGNITLKHEHLYFIQTQKMFIKNIKYIQQLETFSNILKNNLFWKYCCLKLLI